MTSYFYCFCIGLGKLICLFALKIVLPYSGFCIGNAIPGGKLSITKLFFLHTYVFLFAFCIWILDFLCVYCRLTILKVSFLLASNLTVKKKPDPVYSYLFELIYKNVEKKLDDTKSKGFLTL